MLHSTCAPAPPGVRGDGIFGVDTLSLLEVTTRDDGVLVLDVQSDQTLTGCPDCGVVAVGHGRRVQVLHDAPCFARAVRVCWFKRIWRCREPACPRATWTEDHSFAAPRAKLTARAVAWAVDALRHDDTTESTIARHLGLACDTCWSAIKPHAETFIKVPGRVRGVKTIGADEHIWRPSRVSSTDKAVTVMVDLTRDADGCLHARLLDAVHGRSGRVYAVWLREQGVELTATVEHAALAPIRGYMNAIRDERPDATAVLDASMSRSWPATPSTSSDAVSSRPRCIGVATRTTRTTGSAGPCSPTGNDSGSTATDPSATRMGKSNTHNECSGWESGQHIAPHTALPPRSRASHACPVGDCGFSAAIARGHARLGWTARQTERLAAHRSRAALRARNTRVPSVCL